jgi:hypothetical protein
LVITSNPPRPEFVVRTTGDGLSLGLGDGESFGLGDDDGGAEGVGVGEPCSVKLAHGTGGTLAQRRCRPGPSPGNGVTTFVKLPWPSAVTLVAT